MRTNFTEDLLRDPAIAEAERTLRNCVHCGFCLATCPTYLLTGDELESPRGRIYLIKNMLEDGGPPTPEVVGHIDRCLSCLSCQSHCPSGVDYGHLVDHARAVIEARHRRPWGDRLLRALLAALLVRPRVFRRLLPLARALRPAAALLPRRLKAMVRAAPPPGRPVSAPATEVGPGGGRRVVLHPGCVQQALAPEITDAAARLLRRQGCQVIVPRDAPCCGALAHHLGRADEARKLARANAALIGRLANGGTAPALIATAAGCGAMFKDYGSLLAGDGATIAAEARDVTELIAELGLPEAVVRGLPTVAYHAACALHHGQRAGRTPQKLLEQAGFKVVEPAEGHLCCGQAGSYALLEPEISGRLARRKARNLLDTGAEAVAAGNIGCITQLAPELAVPVVHTVQLLDWATGGPAPIPPLTKE